ncbi:MAG: ATP-dependent RecD-like DNA helicase [Chloroflexi bacterium]|nr:ATP-dependent RecD-like DNA helicase [Chloroflexota bacterium]
MDEQLAGTIERITYYNEDNGYSVVKILPDKRYPRAQARDGTVAVVGFMPQLNEGESAEFTGEWVTDPKYGRQFRAQQAMPVAPSTTEGIINYLSSGIVRGIGPVTAEKIVNHLGEDTVAILDAEPERVYDVPRLKRQLAERLIEAWPKKRAERNILIYLQGLGISARIAQRIVNEYSGHTRQIIENNPYQLADDVFLIGFRKADQIARNMGLQLDDTRRLRAGLHFALNEMAREGHTYAPRNELLEKAADLLAVHDVSALTIALQGQVAAGKLIEDELPNGGAGEPVRLRDLLQDSAPVKEAIYLPRFFRAETAASQMLRNIASAKSPISRDHRDTDWPRFLTKLGADNEISLSSQQQDAVRAALTSKLSVLTGGPGTGKTTTLRMLISALHAGDYRFNLASPTGRAAKRLGEATGEEASTIHRLLGFSPDEGGFEHDESNPLPADMVVIDEASMLDLQLFHSLLKALQPTAHLLLVGDVDQLPSVGAGNVLRDVIDSGIAEVTRLEQIFRQDDKSRIVSNAHRINRGEHPLTDNQAKDFFFFNLSDPEAVADEIIQIVKTKVPARWSLDPVQEIQVIAPMYRGAAGVNNLNSRLQAELNGDFRQAEVKLGSRLFRVGDKVMQTRNNYDKEVFNGDIGFIDSIDDDDNSLEVVIDGNFVAYDFSEMDDLMHAYCISTHRSQGSEYPAVVMPILTQHYMMLQRNLLYTAITRAKRLVILVGTRQAVQIAVNNNKVAERHSGLLQRLRV